MPRTILITGCSSGIGHALAQAFIANGDRVVATARRVDTLQELVTLGAIGLPLDVTCAESRAGLILSLEKHGITVLDMLINNAGISAMGPLLELPDAKLQGQFATNVIAPVQLVQNLFPLLQGGTYPLVVNIGSVSGILTTPFAGAYCASKAALHSISDALRMELAPFGIQVVTIQPGAIQSNFGDAAAANIEDWMSAGSQYAAIRDGIMARAGASQVGATPNQKFAQAVVKGLAAKAPASVQRYGYGSSMLPLLQKLIPAGLRERILSRKFGLNRLQPGRD